MDTSLDGLLNRSLWVEQPKQGFRIAVDTVFLAASVPAKAGETVLELGCGVGGALLCLAYRVPSLRITGIEIQPELVKICLRNIARNRLQSNITVMQGDVTTMPQEPRGSLPLEGRAGEGGGRRGKQVPEQETHTQERFDHALMNPPYHEETSHDASPHPSKGLSNTEKQGDLSRWIDSATRALKPQGTLTLIHRADRLDEIVKRMETDFGKIEILHLKPKENTPPQRVIIRARKKELIPTAKSSSPWVPLPSPCQPLTLHKPEGGYTDEAEAILRHAKPLQFIPLAEKFKQA